MRVLVLLIVVVGTLAGPNPDVCVPPKESYGPLPPVLPENYHMLYEINDVEKQQSALFEVWYDWTHQRVRMQTIQDGLGFVGVYFYSLDIMFNYVEPRPSAKREEEDTEREFTCNLSKITDDQEEDAKIPFYINGGQPLNMVDIYQALLYGGKYRYAFVKNESGEESRYINTNEFRACVYEKDSDRTLNVTYHWTTDENLPVRCEIEGGVLLNATSGQFNKTHQILSVILFEKDPELDDGIFEIPRHMHCRGDPRETTSFPALSADFAWREETISSTVDDQGVVQHNIVWDTYKEVWSSQIGLLARVDWTPTAEEESSLFANYIGQPIQVVADVDFGAVFITNTITGECKVDVIPEDFYLVNKSQGGGFYLKSPHEILGLTQPHVNKDMYEERGSKVMVFSRLDGDELDSGSTRIHEVSFRQDNVLANRTNHAFQMVPFSQLTREVYSDNVQDFREHVKQTNYFKYKSDYFMLDKFESPGCMTHRERRYFQAKFNGTYSNIIFGLGNEFMNQFRWRLFTIGGLGTVMRVQQLQASFDSKNDVVITMTMLEPFTEIPSIHNATVDEVKQTISATVDKGGFSIPIQWNGLTNTLYVLEHSFKEFYLDRNATEASNTVLSRRRRETVQKSSATIDTGYSDATLVTICFVAFLIGGVTGFFIIRKWFLPPTLVNTQVVKLSTLEANVTQREAHDLKPGPSGAATST